MGAASMSAVVPQNLGQVDNVINLGEVVDFIQDPEIPVNDKMKAIAFAIGKGGKVAEDLYQKNIALQQKNDSLSKRVSKLEIDCQKAQEQSKEAQKQSAELQEKNKKIQDQIDERDIQPLREKIIKEGDSGDKFVEGVLAGHFGFLGGFYGMGVVAFALGASPVIAPASAVAGAVAAVKYQRNSYEARMKRYLERLEKEYLESHPGASKKEAFEYAIKAMKEAEEASRKKAQEEPIDWSDADPSSYY
jgi:hypothetical protein